MRKRSETCFLVAVALISSTLGFSFADAQQKVAREETSGTKDRFTQNFLAEHEIGRRYQIDPGNLPTPKSGSIVTDRSLTLPYAGQIPQVPPGFTATPFVTGLVNPRRLLVLPNGDVLVAEQSAGYLTLLRDDGGGQRVDRAPRRGPQQALWRRLAGRPRSGGRPGWHLEVPHNPAPSAPVAPRRSA